MKTERWQRIEELFQAALNYSPRQRVSFLKTACAEDEALRAEVESLLAAHDEPDSFTAGPAFAEGMALLKEERSDSALGRRIGPYRLLRELGHGGMGTVYLAARAD